MKRLLAALMALATVLTLPAWAGGESGIVQLMGMQQTYLHKLGLAVDQGNKPLAKFYAHELEETLEQLEAIDEYKGYNIGVLTETMAWTAFAALEEAIEDGDQAQMANQYQNMINACNECHRASDHGFIRIEHNNANPYLQSFAP